ncbi:hypothetical protein NJLHNGOC_07590 [Novacetimonas cocois]|uniref:Uncharacterized protein n=1 Tax=Novacetimonas cocois TaxID=1747507 RepID=A0A365YWV4_9PROT|nr:hypothetical protein NJLHNGOC_07590 [Novacetimonas cocois]
MQAETGPVLHVFQFFSHMSSNEGTMPSDHAGGMSCEGWIYTIVLIVSWKKHPPVASRGWGGKYPCCRDGVRG